MLAETLLKRLADGAWHAPEDVSGTAARQHVAQFRTWGLELQFDESGRCRLDWSLDLIDVRALRAALPATVRSDLGRLVVGTELRSTNEVLLRGCDASRGHVHPDAGTHVHAGGEPAASACDGWLDVCIAEYQSAGRGRRGRQWQAPLASGVCLSVGCRLTPDCVGLAVLPMLTGVAVRRAIRELTGLNAGLKWPNDLVWRNRKLGGILVERSVAGAGSARVVVGVGLNVHLPAGVKSSLSDWSGGAADLSELGRLPPRSAIAAALVTALWRMLAGIRSGRTPSWEDEWRDADILAGNLVHVMAERGEFEGHAVGVDHLGALLIDGADGVQRRVTSADVSVRCGTGTPVEAVQPRSAG